MVDPARLERGVAQSSASSSVVEVEVDALVSVHDDDERALLVLALRSSGPLAGAAAAASRDEVDEGAGQSKPRVVRVGRWAKDEGDDEGLGMRRRVVDGDDEVRAESWSSSSPLSQPRCSSPRPGARVKVPVLAAAVLQSWAEGETGKAERR